MSDGGVEKTEYEWCSAGRWRFVGSAVLEDVDLEAVAGGGTNSIRGP
ncbi:hypothetical protein [Natrialba sp. SSL1]|nr:hypothetical protein [Natrialba sp. SSL1]